MPRFIYKAKKGPEKIIEGVLEKDNRDAAIAHLIQVGYTPIQVNEEMEVKGKIAPSFGFSKRIRPVEITVFTQQLASLVKAGVSILDAIGIIFKQTDNSRMKEILSYMHKELEDGKMLSGALSNYPGLFSPFYVNMIRAGEIGGILKDSLARLVGFREEEEEMKATVTSALAYPIFIVLVGILTIFVLITFAVPRLTVLFEESGQALPFITRVLVSTSMQIKNYGFLVLIAIAIIFFRLKRMKINEKEKLALDRFKLKLPLFGGLIKKTGLARFSRSFGVLLGSGIPILQAIHISMLTLDNEIFKAELKKIEKSLTDGASLAHGVENSDYFPSFMSNMIAVGEKSGNLESALMEIAHFYEREVRKITKVITSLLEPAIILVMGLVVGFIVFAMLLPIFEINLAVR